MKETKISAFIQPLLSHCFPYSSSGPVYDHVFQFYKLEPSFPRASVVKLHSFLRAIKKKEIDICSYCKPLGNEVWLDRGHVEKCYVFFSVLGYSSCRNHCL